MSAEPLRVCLVTGGTRGIGRAIAEELIEAGAVVFATYRESTASAEAFATQIASDRLKVVKADVTSEVDSRQLIADIEYAFGRLDVLVNNAGLTSNAAFATYDATEYGHVIDTNFTGVLRLSLIAAPLLRRSRGSIVNVSSLAGVVGSQGQVIYAMTKGGVIGFTRSLARRLGPEGVQVNAVAPGFIATDMVKPLSEKHTKHILLGSSVPRLGEVADVASVATFLASGRCGYVSGQTIRVDGGFHR